jgi:hypothetical protein
MKLRKFIKNYFKIICFIAFIINLRIQYDSIITSVNNDSLSVKPTSYSNKNMILEHESQKINKNFMTY